MKATIKDRIEDFLYTILSLWEVWIGITAILIVCYIFTVIVNSTPPVCPHCGQPLY